MQGTSVAQQDSPTPLITAWDMLRELNSNSPRPLSPKNPTEAPKESTTPTRSNKHNRRSIDGNKPLVVADAPAPVRKGTTPSPRKKNTSDPDKPLRRIERSKSQSQIDRSSASRVPRSHSFSLRGHHDSPADAIPQSLSNSLSSIGKPEKKKNHVQADYRLLVLGSVGVGKSCLVLRYLQGVFVDRYDPTVEDAHLKTVERNGNTYTVEIIDTAGAEAYSSLTDLLIRKVDGVLLLYSVNSFSSFLKAIELNDKLDVAHETEPLPKVFVGTKLDLAKTHREVQVDAVNDTATRCRCPWVEVSAKENIAVEDAFVMLLDRVIAQHSQAKKSGCAVM